MTRRRGAVLAAVLLLVAAGAVRWRLEATTHVAVGPGQLRLEPAGRLVTVDGEPALRVGNGANTAYVRLRNTGRLRLTVRMEQPVDGPAGGYTGSSPSSVRLGPGEEREVALRYEFDRPCAVDPGQDPASYGWSVVHDFQASEQVTGGMRRDVRLPLPTPLVLYTAASC